MASALAVVCQEVVDGWMDGLVGIWDLYKSMPSREANVSSCGPLGGV
jgi:hypothetical protein